MRVLPKPTEPLNQTNLEQTSTILRQNYWQIRKKQKNSQDIRNRVEQQVRSGSQNNESQKMIIGEKIRGYQEGSFKNISFNDQHLASILHKEEDRQLSFYRLETVQKLVDFQFMKTKQFLNLIIKLYVCGFLGPFILSITLESYFLKNLCYIACFVTQCFLFIFEVV